ncbi:hypothetical protein FISHEDRAFT_30171, partial [Fistulina hepatica ATCC 64428]
SSSDKPAGSSPLTSPGRHASTTAKPLSELIDQHFSHFEHQKEIVGPFGEETLRDQSFEQELGQKLLDIILEAHAWSAARPKHESQVAVARYEKKIAEVMEAEKQQGTSMP